MLEVLARLVLSARQREPSLAHVFLLAIAGLGCTTVLYDGPVRKTIAASSFGGDFAVHFLF